jgi:uncharacterized protein involved in exopolysaccharide biosynthesis
MLDRTDVSARGSAEVEGVDLPELVRLIAGYWQLLLLGPLAAGVIALGITFLVPKVYTARTLFLPPQQQQSSAAASAIAQLGALSGLAGVAAGIKSPADQYVSLLQSAAITDRLIDHFELTKVYEVDFRDEARLELDRNTRIALGKKDGLISIEVDDTNPQRAADIANRHVDELRWLTGQLAITEAQQRRLFFETQLTQTRDRLVKAQETLQGSGFSPGALRADARASAEGYARLKAEATAAEVRYRALRQNLADSTPEVQQAVSVLSALRAQLAKLEGPTELAGTPDYVSKYREFKYQETLFELFARQYELARVDESREGAMIQVIDTATAAERHSWPRRGLIVALAVGASVIALMAYVFMRRAWMASAAHRTGHNPR